MKADRAEDEVYMVKGRVSHKILWGGLSTDLNLYVKALTSAKMRNEYIIDYPIKRQLEKLGETLSLCTHTGNKAKRNDKG